MRADAMRCLSVMCFPVGLAFLRADTLLVNHQTYSAVNRSLCHLDLQPIQTDTEVTRTEEGGKRGGEL